MGRPVVVGISDGIVAVVASPVLIVLSVLGSIDVVVIGDAGIDTVEKVEVCPPVGSVGAVDGDGIPVVVSTGVPVVDSVGGTEGSELGCVGCSGVLEVDDSEAELDDSVGLTN